MYTNTIPSSGFLWEFSLRALFHMHVRPLVAELPFLSLQMRYLTMLQRYGLTGHSRGAHERASIDT